MVPMRFLWPSGVKYDSKDDIHLTINFAKGLRKWMFGGGIPNWDLKVTGEKEINEDGVLYG